MDLISTILLLIAILAIGAVVRAWACGFRRRPIFSNSGEGTDPSGNITFFAEVAFTTRYLLGRAGTADNEVLIGTEAAKPMGVVTDEPAQDAQTKVQLLSAPGTKRLVASAAIAVDADIYAAAGGKVQPIPTSTGVYWKLGRCVRNPATGDGDVLVAETHAPVKQVFIDDPADHAALLVALEDGPAEIHNLSLA